MTTTQTTEYPVLNAELLKDFAFLVMFNDPVERPKLNLNFMMTRSMFKALTVALSITDDESRKALLSPLNSAVHSASRQRELLNENMSLQELLKKSTPELASFSQLENLIKRQMTTMARKLSECYAKEADKNKSYIPWLEHEMAVMEHSVVYHFNDFKKKLPEKAKDQTQADILVESAEK